MAKLATSAVVLPILARFLGIEGYGQYAYYQCAAQRLARTGLAR